ncbi:MAG TPA: serine/threonine-protein kinase [Solirubrobacterales bacterium]|jgi:serine/threonine-protein kinase
MSPILERGARLRGGRYEIERLLGHGGAASVWLARDTLLERPVAVKVLSEGLASDAAWLARFRREARIAARLQHPNLVSVYDFDADGDHPFLVMAYLPGGSLARRLDEGRAIDCERLARDLLAALAHIHDAGIVHRDVKPGNVLFAPDGRACLSDFGIARPEEATALTRTGQIPGTARYMAPELWQGDPASPRTDLYSCGVVLARCLGDDADPRLTELVARLTSPDPEARPGSAEAALALLGEAARSPRQPVAAAPPPVAAPSPELAPSPARPRARVAAALALGLGVIAAAVALVIALGGNESAEDPVQRAQGEERRQDDGARGDAAREPDPSQAEPSDREPVVTASGSNPELGAALNNRGYELIQQGRYAEAVPILKRAVRAFPPGTDDLNYAYALFNLGNALRLSGRPEEAIPILEERLRIPDQIDVVRRELAAARRAARGAG